MGFCLAYNFFRTQLLFNSKVVLNFQKRDNNQIQVGFRLHILRIMTARDIVETHDWIAINR